MKRSWLLVPAFLMPALVFAHSGPDAHVHGFPAGLAHPWGGLDHLLAMLAIGMFAARLGGHARWLVPACFVTTMALAAVAGMSGFVVMLPVEQFIAASVLVLGLVVAVAFQPALPVALAIAAVTAAFHGYAHGIELPAGAGAATYVAGFACGTALLHVVGFALGTWIGRARAVSGRWAARGAGGAIAAAGVALLLT